jgi:GTPase SAR1 family protein
METDIAPCDIIDFGGQDAFDMIHQLFISQRGTFCFMFDGRNNLNDILEDQKRTTAGTYG